MRILLVEDDRLLGDGIRVALEREACTVDWCMDGVQALSAARAAELDVIVLDLSLPGLDGLEVLRHLRRERISTPVLVLTARDGVRERIQGLDAGADDYLGKPFDVHELLARLRALHRRRMGGASSVLNYGSVTMDLAAGLVRHQGRLVELPRREYALLRVFLEHAGRILSRDVIQEKLYRWDESVESNALEVYIHHLRRKFYPELIQTVRGVGYRLPAEPMEPPQALALTAGDGA